ncbi:hypothetical protein VKT23_015750 [Stygiomarasmius scandens]|uniref:Fungal-type protein kinase domain-containing protein n=1 Tax=Marasmiellus scandens TaxID=2682957 RepID=A0ABR1IX63_9AGAR
MRAHWHEWARGIDLGQMCLTGSFMSHELLGNSLHGAHLPIHDMESLFYVLAYLCVSRDGPGNHVRKELLDDEMVRSCIFKYFESDPAVLLENKQALFDEDIGSAVLQQNILPYVHPYFESLKPLLKEWHRILLMGCIPQRINSGFSSMEFVYPWVFFRTALQECLSAAEYADEHDQDQYKSMMAAEDDRRRKDREDILKVRDDIVAGRVVQPHSDDEYSQRDQAEFVRQRSTNVDSTLIALDDQVGSVGRGSLDASLSESGSLEEGPSRKRQRFC